MDGELPAEECELLLKRLAVNGEMAWRWHAYHLIGDAMRGQLVSSAARELAPRVGRALVTPEPAHSTHRGPRRFAALAAGVAVIGLAGLVGALVSQQVGGGKVFTPEGSTTSRGLAPGAAQVNWQQTPSPVRAELNRYLMMHDLYGSEAAALADGDPDNAVVLTATTPIAATAGQGPNPRQ